VSTFKSSLLRAATAAFAATIASAAFAQVHFGGHLDTGRGMDVPMGTRYAAKQFVVKFQPHINPRSAQMIASQYGLTIDRRVSNSFFTVLTIPQNSQQRVENLVRTFRLLPSVRYAEVDPEITPDYVPNDPRINELYAMNNTGQTGGTPDADVDGFEAWDVALNHPDVIVAVCDDGFDHGHEDLMNQFHINAADPVNGIDDDNNGFIDDHRGWDFSSGDNDVQAQNGDSHGTHVMGTVAAEMDNNKGVAGIGPNIKVMPLRMYGGPANFMSALTAAVDYAWQNGAVVISVSYNIDGYTNALLDAIKRAETADVIYCNSAGNNGQQNPPRQVIRTLTTNTIFVAANDDNDGLANFSNYGSQIDISAAGVDILSTGPGNSYFLSSGTSMSTPLAAGILGVIRAQNPTMSAREALDHLIDTADVVPQLAGFVVGGKRANLNNAMTGGGASGGPASVNVILGLLSGGDLGALGTEDDVYYSVMAQVLASRGMYAVYDLQFNSAVAGPNVTSLKFEIEAKSTGAATTMIVMFYNHTTAQYDRIRTHRLSANDRVFEAIAGTNRSDYVAANGAVYVRVEALEAMKRGSKAIPAPFTFATDVVSLTVGGS